MNKKAIKPEVTVLCITYNHAAYIRDCLDGMVLQKTKFPFQVIVHDDASTDGTVEIVEEYAKAYPDIIYPIIEKENQFSKGVRTPAHQISPIQWGKYIACCEGDDYWMDSNKLQLQYDFMESHPDYSLCVHNAIINDLKYEFDYLSEPNKTDKDKTCEDIIFEGGGKFNPTASFFIRTSCEWPTIEHNCSANDHFELIKLASRGKVHWISKPMSVYRWGVKGSWTDRQEHVDLAQAVHHVDSRVEALHIFDKATRYVYHDSFERRIQTERDKLVVVEHIQCLQNADSIIKALCLDEISIHEKLKFVLQKILPKQMRYMVWRAKKVADRKKDSTFISSSNKSYVLSGNNS